MAKMPFGQVLQLFRTEKTSVLVESHPLVTCAECWKREYDNCPFREFADMYPPGDDFFCKEGESRPHDGQPAYHNGFGIEWGEDK